MYALQSLTEQEPFMTTPYEEVVILEVGEPAPQFSLPAHPHGTVSLQDFHGKQNVILAFYPKDDTPGCTKEMCTFSDRSVDFGKVNTVILGISTDTAESHAKFALDYGLQNTLLADTTRATGISYGAVRGDRIMSERILFVIDKAGKIRHIHSGMPDFDDLLALCKVLDEMQSEEQ
jgi:thioredoxin-dependent peroxiredoxin